MSDEDLKKIVGKPTSKATVVVERSAVTNFATAVCDDNPVYRDARAAAEAGFPAIPAPPTFAFVMTNWGQFPEVQPDDVPSGNAMGEVIGPLMAKGGLSSTASSPSSTTVRCSSATCSSARAKWSTPTPRSPRARP